MEGQAGVKNDSIVEPERGYLEVTTAECDSHAPGPDFGYHRRCSATFGHVPARATSAVFGWTRARELHAQAILLLARLPK